MNSIMIILEVIFLIVSGMSYMSLIAYAEEYRFYRKRVLLAVVLLGISLPGIVSYAAGQSAEESWGFGLLCCSVLFAVLSVLWLLYLLAEGKRNDFYREDETELFLKEGGAEEEAAGKKGWFHSFAGSVKDPVTRKELLLLAGLTLLYGFLIFYHLGSLKTPQTSLDLVADGINDEIILDLGEEKEVSAVQIYLGHMLDRMVAFSYYDTKAKEWVPLEEELNMESNYCWNELEIHKKIRYLGLVSRSIVASYQELVILDEEGNQLLPVNAEDYPELFDEQELYPKEMTYYDTTMFDEVYYAGSAYEFLNGMQMYETTHPPMGKILIAIGEVLFGVTPFGWRFVCALAGVLAVPLFFWFLYLVTENGRIALLGTVLYCLDFMHYTLSRIATLDSIIAFFIILMITLLLLVFKQAEQEISEGRRRPSFRLVLYMVLDGISVGMGVATKWTGFYAMLGMALLFLFFIGFYMGKLKKAGQKLKYVVKLFIYGIVDYSVLPLLVYLSSFIPQMRAEGSHDLFQVMWESSLFMLDFHSDIVFEHPYESPWYTWILDLVPLVDAGSSVGEDGVSMIATLGNPFIWWAGAAAFFYLLVRVIRHKDKRAGVLCFCYLMMLVPWFFVKRTVFIYQYYVSSIFLCGMLGYTLYLLGKKKKQVIPIFLESAFFLFLMFFPVISGATVNSSHVLLYLQWFETWQFLIVGGGA